MDYTTLILGTTAIAALVGLAFMSGWELGSASGIDRERQSANRRVNGVLASVKDVIAYENTRKPKAAKNRRKAARKVVRA
jgi:L-cystine uptake protein TcyP (sodium:dicarboxylate symporter family)